MRFVWDEAKNLANKAKHGVSFEEASKIFAAGSDRLDIFDEAHSLSEDRFISVALSSRGLLVVIWNEPAEDVVRLISARRATKRESMLYRTWLKGGKND